LSPETGVKKDRGRLEVHADRCKGCGLCVAHCPPQVIEIDTSTINALGYNPARYTGAGCTACGTCFYCCPEPGAITVRKLARLVKSRW
jgi:Pyruvate/2-oxoacid:ferredoxin oxidoreductase delta subunit